MGVGLRLLLPLALSLLAALTAPAAQAAAVGPDVAIEIDPEADRLLDARLTRKLIALELREVEVPPTPSSPRGVRRSMFVRVLGEARDRLRVELWELGVFHGSRSVTVTPQGSRYLRAQRIALVSAELARRLRQERLRQLREEERARSAMVVALPGAEASLPRSRLLLSAFGRGALVGPHRLGLIGPGLGGELTVLGRASIDMSAAWLLGGAFGMPEAPAVEWLELSVSPSYSIPYSSRLGVRLGIRAAVASLHLGRVSAVDGIRGQHDTWSARAVAELRADVAATRQMRLRVGPDFGALVRPVLVLDQRGAQHSLGGFWVGLSLGITLDPATRDLSTEPPKARGLAPHGTDSRAGLRP